MENTGKSFSRHYISDFVFVFLFLINQKQEVLNFSFELVLQEFEWSGCINIISGPSSRYFY